MLFRSGAMRSSQNPHLVDFSGVITVSSDITPAPTVSPLNSGYKNEVKEIADSLNTVKKAIDIYNFDNFKQFTEIMTTFVKEGEPFTLGANK